MEEWKRGKKLDEATRNRVELMLEKANMLGLSKRAIAKQCGVSAKFVDSVDKQRKGLVSSAKAKKKQSRNKTPVKLTADVRERLNALIEQHPSESADGLLMLWAARNHDTRLSTTTIRRYKKSLQPELASASPASAPGSGHAGSRRANAGAAHSQTPTDPREEIPEELHAPHVARGRRPQTTPPSRSRRPQATPRGRAEDSDSPEPILREEMLDAFVSASKDRD